MLGLDSPRWAELQHAYGSATDIPSLLRQLSTLPDAEGDAEPWYSLWSALALPRRYLFSVICSRASRRGGTCFGTGSRSGHILSLPCLGGGLPQDSRHSPPQRPRVRVFRGARAATPRWLLRLSRDRGTTSSLPAHSAQSQP